MRFNSPSLELTFLGDDIDPSHSRTQLIDGSYIIRNSVEIKYQLLNGLKSASNQAVLQIKRKCPSTEDIIATDCDIRAVLCDGERILFTGYLSTNYTWNVCDTGEEALNITLEDTGTRLLGKNFIDTGYHLFSCTVHNALKAVCTKAGISISVHCEEITEAVTRVVESGVTCQDIISQLLYEVGYVYYFDSLGELMVFKIDCTSTDNVPVLDKDKLYVYSDKAISLSKKIRQYKSAKVTFRSLGTAADYLIYRNTSNQSSDYPYCNMEIEGGYYYDGTEMYTPEEWEEMVLDRFRIPALIEACNADSEIEKVGSNKIISISDLRFVFEEDSGTVLCEIEEAGGPYIKIAVHNTSDQKKYVLRMDAYASIIYEKDISIVRTAQIPVTDDVSDNLIEEECTYIHTKELAQRHANLLGQYNRYCNSQYTFYSKDNLELGSIIKLHDNIFSGLKVNVLLTAKTVSGSTDIIKYTAVGISVFDLTEDVWHQYSYAGQARTGGEAGPQGKSAYEVAVDHGYVGTEEEWLKSLIGKQGERGPVGPDGVKITPVEQFYLSTSESSPQGGQWSETLDEWTVGHYIFRRVKYTYEDEREPTYSQVWYDRGQTDSFYNLVRYCFTTDRSTYVRNLRSGGGTTAISLIPDIVGYGSLAYSFSSIEASISNDTITIAYDTPADSITVVMQSSYGGALLLYSLTLAVDDITQKPMYLGVHDSSDKPTHTPDMEELIEGDWFLCSDDGKTYVLRPVHGQLSWVQLTPDMPNYSTIALSTLADKFADNSDVVIDQSLVENQYTRNLIAGTVTAEYIGSKEIALLSGGSLHSDGYEQGTVQKLVDGELDPATTKQGFFQDSEGNAEFFKTDIYQANINKGTVTDVTVIGELNAETFATLKEEAISDDYRNRDITQGTAFWNENDAVLALGVIESDSVQEVYGSYNGRAYSYIIKLNDEQKSRSRSIINRTDIRDSVTAEGSPELKTNTVKFSGTPLVKKVDTLTGTVTATAKMEYSLDGINWTQFTGIVTGKSAARLQKVYARQTISYTATGYMFRPAVYNASLASAVSYYYSYDVPALYKMNNGVYCLIQNEDSIVYSQDGGNTWAKASVASQEYCGGASAIGNGRIVIISSCYDGSEIPSTFISTDGKTFAAYNLHTACSRGDWWSGISFVNGYFYAYHTANLAAYMVTTMRSSDGINWTQVTTANVDYICPNLSTGNAAYSIGETVYKSTDGINWSQIGTTGLTGSMSAAYVNGKIYASDANGKVAVSTDGRSWQVINSNALHIASGDTSFFSVRGDGYISRGAEVTPSDYVIQQSGKLEVSYTYDTFSEGMNFLDDSYDSIGRISMVNPQMVSYALTCLKDGNTLFNYGTAVKYYRLRGLEHYTGTQWQYDEANEYVKFVNISLIYRKLGETHDTEVFNITSIKWTTSYISVTQNRISTITFTTDMFFSLFSLAFTPVGRLRGNYTESIFPAKEPEERGEIQITVGTSANPFDAVYSANVKSESIQGTVITGDKVYGAYWNDIADAIEVDEKLALIPGRCYVKTENGHALSERYCQKGIVGVHSDTFGFLIGKKEKKNELYVAVGGFVLACVDKVYPPGTALTSSKDGYLTRMGLISKILHPERIAGTFYREEKDSVWNGINVSGRHWIKVR